MKPRSLKNRRGFTLIELLVVITIISILASLIILGSQKALQKARTVKCSSNLHQIGEAFHLYLQDNNDIMPQRVYPKQVDGIEYGYDELLMTYTGDNREIFKCPEHSGVDSPNQPSYGMNWYYDNMNAGRVVNPSKTILATDSEGDYGGGSHRADRDSGSPGQLADTRHNGKANYLFFDGHVELLKYEATLAPNDMWGTDGGDHVQDNP